ncbi:phosphotransferase, partial [Xanthomonas oryzae pv. oryzicola]
MSFWPCWCRANRRWNAPRMESRMQGRDAIATLIPHQGSMCLWEDVIEWDA